jgi:hypothetical protein
MERGVEGMGIKFQEEVMNLRNVPRKVGAAPKEWGSYFGLPVQIIARMSCWSLIRLRGREFVVDTEDLRLIAKLAA